MPVELPVRIILLAPPAGVDFGIQHGKGNDYTTILTQRSKGGDLAFEFSLTAKDLVDDEPPNFVGPIAQGPASSRFFYIDVGTYAGQTDSEWSRRIKVPPGGITTEMVQKVIRNPKKVWEARIPGTGKDGGPSCATVKPVAGWQFG